jgi:hypothetical protein
VTLDCRIVKTKSTMLLRHQSAGTGQSQPSAEGDSPIALKGCPQDMASICFLGCPLTRALPRHRLNSKSCLGDRKGPKGSEGDKEAIEAAADQP